ncbi:MAG: aminotransferase class III-fold pyridoxal phosphate-dependent enzyme [Planctomycetota bacterium]|jgi:4-aminobutyrate aminotransferase-like enzyme
MTIETTSSLVADQFADSSAVTDAIGRIVAALQRSQEDLTGVRPPAETLQASYEETLSRLAEVRGRGLLYPYVGSGLGRGPLVELMDGSVKWDLINGIGVHMFGHSDPDMIATALRAALSDTVMQGNLQCNLDALRFAELLVEEGGRGSGLRHCFLTGSGAMANEAALKVCMQQFDARAPRVVAFADCFMGRSTTMAQIGDNPAGRVGLPLNVLVDYLPFYDPEHGDRSIQYTEYHLRQYFDRYQGQHACVVMELVQGEGGFNVAPRAFFEPLMRLCRERGVAVWVDEVQTLYTEKYNPKPGLLSGTFLGSSVGLQTGLRALERMRDGGHYRDGEEEGHIARLFRVFGEHVQAMVEKHPDWFPPVPHPAGLSMVASGFFGGVGGMMRFTPFGGDKEHIMRLLHRMFDLGVIAFYCGKVHITRLLHRMFDLGGIAFYYGHGPYHVRFLPPVSVMQPEHFCDVFEIVEAAMASVEAEMSQESTSA